MSTLVKLTWCCYKNLCVNLLINLALQIYVSGARLMAPSATTGLLKVQAIWLQKVKNNRLIDHQISSPEASLVSINLDTGCATRLTSASGKHCPIWTPRTSLILARLNFTSQEIWREKLQLTLTSPGLKVFTCVLKSLALLILQLLYHLAFTDWMKTIELWLKKMFPRTVQYLFLTPARWVTLGVGFTSTNQSLNVAASPLF